MRTEQPTKCLYHISYGESGCAHKTSLGPQEFVTDRSKAVVLTWFSIACFGVRVSVMFHLMFVWRKKLRTRLAICTNCIFIFYFFPILVLRAKVITMPELMEINLVSDDGNSLADRK